MLMEECSLDGIKELASLVRLGPKSKDIRRVLETPLTGPRGIVEERRRAATPSVLID